MICPICEHDNVPGSEHCSNCLHDLAQLDHPTAHDRIERSLMEDPVTVLRFRQAVTVPQMATVGEAVKLLLENNLGALLVVGEGGRLVGIFSERDLMARMAGVEDWTSQPVASSMTPDPECVQTTHTLAFALHKMDVGGYRHLPVVLDGQPLGMVSVRDMLRHITRLCKSS